MPQFATGSFDVKITPTPLADTTADSTLGRMTIDKKYHGDLEATAKGEMLTAMGVVKGSAGYVAVERITGTLHGRKGSFSLQHNGVMNRGEQHLTIMVVPDSGSGQLTGLSGDLSIRIAEGKHFYELQYSLPDEKPLADDMPASG